jgi:hypothetical protein
MILVLFLSQIPNFNFGLFKFEIAKFQYGSYLRGWHFLQQHLGSVNAALKCENNSEDRQVS